MRWECNGSVMFKENWKLAVICLCCFILCFKLFHFYSHRFCTYVCACGHMTHSQWWILTWSDFWRQTPKWDVSLVSEILKNSLEVQQCLHCLLPGTSGWCCCNRLTVPDGSFSTQLLHCITKYQSDLLSNLCPTITALNLTLFLQKIVLFLYLVLQRSFSKTRSRTPSEPSSVWDLLMSPSISLLVWWTNIVFSVTQLFHRTFVNKNPSVNLTAQLTFFLLSSCMSFIALN